MYTLIEIVIGWATVIGAVGFLILAHLLLERIFKPKTKRQETTKQLLWLVILLTASTFVITMAEG